MISTVQIISFLLVSKVELGRFMIIFNLSITGTIPIYQERLNTEFFNECYMSINVNTVNNTILTVVVIIKHILKYQMKSLFTSGNIFLDKSFEKDFPLLLLY